MKISKFLYCENELLSNNKDYILHTRKPRYLAEIKRIHFSELPKKPSDDSITYHYVNPESLIELFELKIIQFYDQADDYFQILKRMADWHIAYLKWQDEQITGKSGNLLKDHNDKTPGLKIIYNGFKWAVIYEGIVESFNSEPEMDEYLYKLGFSDDDLKEGFINKIDFSV